MSSPPSLALSKSDHQLLSELEHTPQAEAGGIARETVRTKKRATNMRKASAPLVTARAKKPAWGRGFSVRTEGFWLCVTSEGPAQVAALAWSSRAWWHWASSQWCADQWCRATA